MLPWTSVFGRSCFLLLRSYEHQTESSKGDELYNIGWVSHCVSSESVCGNEQISLHVRECSNFDLD